MPIDPSTPIDTPLSKLPHFDPREVPVVGINARLPRVPSAALRPDALRSRFARPPAWEPEVSREPRFTDRKTAAASVLIPLVARAEGTSVLLTQRTAHLSTHSGQIAFPGGKRDDTDVDAADTALREAEEEVGLDRRRADVIGTLPLYTTGTMFVITPVVALISPEYSLTLNPDEVDDAFEVPLEFVLDPAHQRRHVLEWAQARREWFSIPYRDGERERFIWGATAAMLRNFYRFVVAPLPHGPLR